MIRGSHRVVATVLLVLASSASAAAQGGYKTETYKQVVNRSVNTTLSRTVIPSCTTLLVVLTLFIFGGVVLRGFAFAMIFGILIGTYSSVFVATPVVVELHERAPQKKPRGRTR